MNNVINFNREGTEPKDLMTFKQFAKKYGTCTSYLYKLYYSGKLSRYKRGYWKISEQEALKVM